MKIPKNKTALIIFIGIIVLGIWDLYCVVFETEHWTVSQVMVDLGMRAPFIVFVFGMCVGHFWFKSGEQT